MINTTPFYHKSLIQTIKKVEELAPKNFDEYSVQLIVDFLEISHQRFCNQLIPEIEQNFLLLIDYFQDNNTLKILFNLFLKFQIDFKQHVRIEEKTMFPYAKILYKASISNSITPALFIHFSKYNIKDFINSHKKSECYLTEIIFLFQKQQEIQNHTIYNVLIKQLCQFDNEIKTHAWIEDNVLVKKVKEIEDALEDFVKTAKS
ncbi:MAG: hypothetical protein P1U44_13640 [Vicingaceae bacterium]|nr:hypothetical protein [Vicingaceae bacterium]